MNDLFPDTISLMLLNQPGFRLLALCAIVLVIKMHAVGVYTGAVRGRVKAPLNPEDAAQYGGQLTEVDHPEVARVLRAHRNDLENIPAFLILALIAVLVGASPAGMRIALIAFTVARIGHSIAYLRGMQPWRSVAFGVGHLSLLAVIVMLALRLVS